MQYLLQKKGQFGLFDATAQDTLGGARFSQADQQCTTQFGDAVRLTIGEWVLDGVPGRFDGVKLGRVGGQFFQLQPRHRWQNSCSPFRPWIGAPSQMTMT